MWALVAGWLAVYGWQVRQWWRGLERPDTPLAPEVEGLTVVVPCRNEEGRLGALLGDLAWMADQILVIDDHSDDATADLARSHGVRVLPNAGHGKKAALRTGFQAATTPWVATLDGDVRVGPDWARALLGAARPDVDAVVGPVRLHRPQPTALDRIQAFEYGAMMAWALTTADAGQAENASGANLLWRRDTWLVLDLEPSEPSGDDAFALAALARRGGRTAAAHGPAATATTAPAPGFEAWAAQRARWGRKARRAALPGPRRAALLVATYPLLLALSLPLDPPTGAALAAGKLLLDAALARHVTRTFHLPWRPLLDDLGFALAYPALLVRSLLKMMGKMNWKNRPI